MESLIHQSSYLGVVLVLLVGGAGVPIPEDLPLLTAGYLCHLREADVGVMVPLAFGAVLAGDLMMFGLGRKYGDRLLRLPWLRRVLTPERLAVASRLSSRYGGRALFVARFLPGVRSCVFITAGALRVPAWKMAVYDGSAALISVPTLILLTYFGGDQIDRFRALAMELQLGLLAAVAAAVLAVSVWRRRRPRSTVG